MSLFSLVLLTFYVASSSAKEENLTKRPVEPTGPFPICAVKCALIGPPVCAVRRGVKKMFPSSCLKAGHYCNTGEIWNQVDLSICTKCICPINCCTYSDSYPLCAKSSSGTTMTFAGQCAFMNYACLHPTED